MSDGTDTNNPADIAPAGDVPIPGQSGLDGAPQGEPGTEPAGAPPAWDAPPAQPAGAWASPNASPFAVGPSQTALVARGLALGAGAAVVAAAIWTLIVVITDYQVGIAAIGVAFLVATAIRYGAGGSSSIGLRVGSVGLTVLSMGFAEFLIVRHFVKQALAAEGLNVSIPLLIAPWEMVMVVGESLAEYPVTLLFWALAVFFAWRFSAPVTPAPAEA
jgi:hypothetical protein